MIYLDIDANGKLISNAETVVEWLKLDKEYGPAIYTHMSWDTKLGRWRYSDIPEKELNE